MAIEPAGRGRFSHWNDTDSKRVARDMARRIKSRSSKKKIVPFVQAPHTRANQPCFYDNGGNPNLVVDSVMRSKARAPSDIDMPEFRVRMKCHASDGEIYLRVEYRHRNGHMVTRWLWETPEQYASLRADARRKRQRRRDEQERLERGEQVGSRHTVRREFERKPILSTQLEPGVTVRCTSYKQFEREVERRGKVIQDGGIK